LRLEKATGQHHTHVIGVLAELLQTKRAVVENLVMLYTNKDIASVLLEDERLAYLVNQGPDEPDDSFDPTDSDDEGGVPPLFTGLDPLHFPIPSVPLRPQPRIHVATTPEQRKHDYAYYVTCDEDIITIEGLTTPTQPEAQTVEAQTVEAQTVEAQTVEAQTVEAQTVEAQTVEAQTVEESTRDWD
jgi:hypothetical protein